MRTRFSYTGDTVIEIVRDGEDLDVIIRPIEVTYEVVASSEEEPGVVAPPLRLTAPVEPTHTKRRRTLMGFIRAAWTFLFSASGEAVTYLLNNMTSLNLPPGTGLAAGASLYGLKRALWPDTLV